MEVAKNCSADRNENIGNVPTNTDDGDNVRWRLEKISGYNSLTKEERQFVTAMIFFLHNKN